MPRLGHDNSGGVPSRPGGGGGGNPRPVAAAYPRGRSSILSTVFLLAFILMLRNMFFKDYRKDEIDLLRSAGKDQEEIAKYIPRTRKERIEYQREKLTDYATMRRDIASLKAQVEELQKAVGVDSSKTEEEKAVIGTAKSDSSGVAVEGSTSTNEKDTAERTETKNIDEPKTEEQTN